MLESIQTSKLLQSTIITGQIGEYDQGSRSPGRDDLTENEELARVTALRRGEDSHDLASPMCNPLDVLVSHRDESSKQSKVMSYGHQLITEEPGVTSGSRFVVEQNPTEPTEFGEDGVQADLEHKTKIRAALGKKT
jgi:hypothetical protein